MPRTSSSVFASLVDGRLRLDEHEASEECGGPDPKRARGVHGGHRDDRHERKPKGGLAGIEGGDGRARARWRG